MLYKLQTPHEVINYSSANEVGNDIVRDGQLIRAIEVYNCYTSLGRWIICRRWITQSKEGKDCERFENNNTRLD